jgi:hypothetical protein
VEKCEICGKALEGNRLRLYYTHEEFEAWQQTGVWLTMRFVCEDCLDRQMENLETTKGENQ